MSPVATDEITGASGASGDGGLQMESPDVSSSNATETRDSVLLTTRVEH